MEKQELKIGHIVELDNYDFTKELFQIVGFTPKRVKVIRCSTGDDYHWYIKSSKIRHVLPFTVKSLIESL
jgi:hypothetical protein